MKRRDTGRLGERIARDFPTRHGYHILETNYRCPHGEIDTDGDDAADHMTCLVYYNDDVDSFLEEDNEILKSLRIVSPTGRVYIMYYPSDGFGFIKNYETGIWIYADPLMETIKGMVGYIEHEPFRGTSIKDVGS